MDVISPRYREKKKIILKYYYPLPSGDKERGAFHFFSVYACDFWPGS